MTLVEWLDRWPYRAVSGPQHAYKIVPDYWDDRPLRREAWHLTDYRVSSVQAGAIYFESKGEQAQ